MTVIRSDTSEFRERFEFHHMSQRPLYRRCADLLIEKASIEDGSTIIDLGCGSGLLTEMLLTSRRPSRIWAIDPSLAELAIAHERISDARVAFITARAEDIVQALPRADVVLLSNVLHQIPKEGRAPLFNAARHLVKPGGTFALNTLFYEGAVLPETRSFYWAWVLRASGHLKAGGVHPRPPAQPPPALQTLTPAEHCHLLRAAGFEEVAVDEVTFEWSADDWTALSQYSVFIRGALGDVPLDAGSEALQKGVHDVYGHLALTRVPRNWLYLVAR